MEAGGIVPRSRPVVAALCLCAVIGPWGRLCAVEAAPDQTDLPALRDKLEALSDDDKAPVLNQIAAAYSDRKDYKEAARWAERALAQAEARGKLWEGARARLNLGIAHYWLEDHPLSLEYLKASWAALEKLDRAPGDVPRGELLKARIDAASWLGYSYQENRDSQASLEALQTGLSLAKSAGDKRSVARFLLRASVGHHLRSEYEKALAAGVESVEKARALGDATLLCDCEYTVGYIYRDLKSWDMALSSFQSALRGAEGTGDELRKALALNEIGNVHMFRGKPREALGFKKRALDAAQRSKDDYTISSCLHDIGEVYMQTGNRQEALSYLQRSLAIDLRRGDEREIAISSKNIARVYIDLGRIGDAQRTLERALPVIEKVDYPVERSEIYGLLSEVYERRGDPARALSYLRKATALKERVLKEEGSRQLQDLQTRYETEKKKKENEALAQENRIKELALTRQTAVRHNLIALSILLVLFVALIYNRYRIKVRAHRELELAHGQIKTQKDELDRANARLEDLSRKDHLTDLSNRRDLEEKFEEEKARFDRTGRPFALIMADLDDFKAVNDNCGHDCGDYVLKTLAGVLRSSLRKLTRIGRWGGDEFLLLLPETNLAGARRVADKIQELLARTPFVWEGRPLDIRISLGISHFREGMEIEDLIREADQDMYRKKRAAKDRAAGLPS